MYMTRILKKKVYVIVTERFKATPSGQNPLYSTELLEIKQVFKKFFFFTFYTLFIFVL